MFLIFITKINILRDIILSWKHIKILKKIEYISPKSLFENLQSISSSKMYFKMAYDSYNITCKYIQLGKRNFAISITLLLLTKQQQQQQRQEVDTNF